METPGFLPARPRPRPARSMETQSRPEGSMLTCSPPPPRRCRGPREVVLLGVPTACPPRGAVPGCGAALDRRLRGMPFGDRALRVTVLTASAGSPGQASGSRSSSRHLRSGAEPGFPLGRHPRSSRAAAARPSGAGHAGLLRRRPSPRRGGTSLPRHRAEGARGSGEISPAVARRPARLGGEGSFHLLL